MNLIPVQSLLNEEPPDETEGFGNNNPAFDDAAYVQFSSGSTGTPKGLIISYRNLLNNIRAIMCRLEIDPETSCVGNWMPLYHDMGFVGYFLLALFSQTNLVLVSTFFFLKRMFDFLRMIDTYHINYCSMTNSMLGVILQRYSEEKCRGLRLDPLRWMGTGAEPIHIPTVRQFQKTFKQYGLRENVVSPCYGLAEATLGVSMSKPLEKFDACELDGYDYPTVGQPLKGVDVILQKDGTLSGDRGIIKIKGDFVVEYSLVAGKKVKITDDEGYYNTNDVGCFLDGKLIATGRIDTMFIVGGENFFPFEVESVLLKSGLLPRPAAVCIPIPAVLSREHRVELVVVYEVNKITDEEKAELDENLKKTVLRETGLQIDEFIAGKRGEISYTTSGKIRYNEMRERYLKGLIRNYLEVSCSALK